MCVIDPSREQDTDESLQGIKIRDLTISTSDPVVLSIKWNRIVNALPAYELKTRRPLNHEGKCIRMLSFDWRHASLEGVTAACSGDRVVAVQTHLENKTARFYADIEISIGYPLVWIFLPLCRGEVLSHILKCHGDEYHLGTRLIVSSILVSLSLPLSTSVY